MGEGGGVDWTGVRSSLVGPSDNEWFQASFPKYPTCRLSQRVAFITEHAMPSRWLIKTKHL